MRHSFLLLTVASALAAPLTGGIACAYADGFESESSRPAKKQAPKKSANKRTTKAKRTKPKKKRHRVQVPDFDVTTTAAWRYGALSNEECEAEVQSRGLPFAPEPTRGVRGAGRITGPIRGITYHTRQSAERRAKSPWEIADCRLVLALDDLAEVLAAHDVVAVRHYSMYRVKAQGQHHAGLAIDPAIFTLRDGTKLDVLDDWHGRIGAKTCGPEAGPRKRTEKALQLRAILCDIAAKRLFNVILTPNHDRAHKNHFHLDITPGAKWFIVD